MIKLRWWEVAAALTVVAIGAGAYVITKVSRRRHTPQEVTAGNDTNNRTAAQTSTATARRPQVSTKHKLTCIAQNVIIRKNSSGKYVVMQECLSHLLSLSKTFDLYIIAQCESDEDETQIVSILEEADAFSKGLDRTKLLFCDTPIGSSHMARHIEPYLHIDTNASSVLALYRFIDSTILVAENGVRPEGIPPKVFVVKSIREVTV